MIMKYLGHQQLAKYEPEAFAEVIYQIAQPRVILLIFVSGKIVMTEAQAKEMFLEATEWVYPILQIFQKKNVPIVNGLMEMGKMERKEEEKKEKDGPFGFNASRAKVKQPKSEKMEEIVERLRLRLRGNVE
jgi:hypothetical protein